MTVGDFQHAIEEWIPPATAWKGDNVGLQVGKESEKLSHILLALDATMEVAREARSKKANLIVTHHPLLFHPLRSVTQSSRAGEIALFLAEQGINLYAAHTNLDHVHGGVSHVLASLLGLAGVRTLLPLTEDLAKVAVFVPTSRLEDVARAMHNAGGGKFRNYEECSFRTDGIGTFKGTAEAKPFIGTPGILEKTPETKLEMLVETWNLGKVTAAMLKAHPYEEVAYDVIPLGNASMTYGLGAIGDLQKPVSLKEMLRTVQKRLGTPSLRYTGRPNRVIRRVAVCGGAGSELISEAARQRADLLVTADVKYHAFQDAEKRLCVIDAGHFETERHILPVLAKRIKGIVGTEKGAPRVYITRTNTNPVSYF